MAKLLITTQVYENYGTADEPYWKPKGGSDYVVKKFKGGEAAATMAVMVLRSQIECDNEGYREYILGWEIVGDKHLTEFEKSQLDYEGKITYGPKELAW
jgi:hypothetical protein